MLLLVLGMAVKPVLGQVAELHAIDHAPLSAGDGHGHDHDAPQDDEPGTDHTHGAHGLMHLGGTGGPPSEALLPYAFQAVSVQGAVLPPTGSSAMPPAQFGTPFRPPIV